MNEQTVLAKSETKAEQENSCSRSERGEGKGQGGRGNENKLFGLFLCGCKHHYGSPTLMISIKLNYLPKTLPLIPSHQGLEF